MQRTIGFSSLETRIEVSHVADGELVLRIRRPIDAKRDKLDWVCVPLEQVPGLESELFAVANRAGFPSAANDDRGVQAGERRIDDPGHMERPARTPA